MARCWRVTGGTGAPGFSDPSGQVDAAELWDPATENWTTLASDNPQIPRVYHSAALLLPDGKVFSTGGNGFPQTEIYSPPYLSRGPGRRSRRRRPASPMGSPSSSERRTPRRSPKITMVRLSSVTHAFNQSQYINQLSFATHHGTPQRHGPLSPYRNRPTAGSCASWLLPALHPQRERRPVRRTNHPAWRHGPLGTIPPTVSISAPTGGATVSGTAVTVAATASDNVGVAGVQFKLDGANLGAEDTTSPYSVPWNSTTATNGSHTLTAVARDAAGNIGTSAGVTVTANNPPVSTITIGETNILSVTDSSNANKLVAQPATLSQTATIQSLSFYVATASGNLRLGIYDATGPGGGPGAKKAETDSITPTTGWNTVNVITPVSLPPGTYWLAYLPSSNGLNFRAERTGGTSKLYSFPFGTMPATFSTTPGSSVWRWSLYATLTLSTADTIPPTVSIDAPTSGATISGTGRGLSHRLR